MEREMCSYLEWQLNVDPSPLRDFRHRIQQAFAMSNLPEVTQDHHGTSVAQAPSPHHPYLSEYSMRHERLSAPYSLFYFFGVLTSPVPLLPQVPFFLCPDPSCPLKRRYSPDQGSAPLTPSPTRIYGQQAFLFPLHTDLSECASIPRRHAFLPTSPPSPIPYCPRCRPPSLSPL